MMTELNKQIGVGDFVVSDKARDYVNQVLNSGRLSYGPFTKRFEEKFAQAHQCRHAIFMASGTCALQLALAAMKDQKGWADGDEVIVPAMTFVATMNTVLMNRLTPRFVDVDKGSCNLDPLKLEAAITDKTRAVIPVHLFGQACDMDPLIEIADRHHLEVLEDSCQTMFGTYRGRPVGSFGLASCFSTYMAHFLVTGVGGFVLSNDDQMERTVRSLLNHGRDPVYLNIDDDQVSDPALRRDIIARRFHFVKMGYSYRLTEMEAALGLAQLEECETMVTDRARHARFLMEHLSGLEAQGHLSLPALNKNVDHMFMVFPLIIHNGRKRDLVNFLEENGVETRDLMPVLNQPVTLETFGDLRSQFPVARYNSEHGFYIGCHQHMTDSDLEKVVALFKTFYKQ